MMRGKVSLLLAPKAVAGKSAAAAQSIAAKKTPAVCFPLPSVIDAKSFCLQLQRGAQQIAGMLGAQYSSDRKTGPLAPVYQLEPADVAAIVKGEYAIDGKTGRTHITDLVPYAAQLQILRTVLPPELVDVLNRETAAQDEVRVHNAAIRADLKAHRATLEAAQQKLEDVEKELKGTSGVNKSKLSAAQRSALPAAALTTLDSEANVAARSEAQKGVAKAEQQLLAVKKLLKPLPKAQLAQWYDADTYVKPAVIDKGATQRTPIVCIMGHIDHGKTTLLDTLQGSNLTASEAGKITQTIRAFTVNCQHVMGLASKKDDSDEGSAGLFAGQDLKYPRELTFVDTPGHKIFVEMRLHGQYATDVVLLLVALDEGVKEQTIEVAKVALAVKRPVVVLFNKIDLFRGNPDELRDAVEEACKGLSQAGLDVKPCLGKTEFKKLVTTKSKKGGGRVSSSTRLEKLIYSPIRTDEAAQESVDASALAAPKAVAASEFDDNKKDQQQTSTPGDAAGDAPLPPSIHNVAKRRRCLGLGISARDGTNVDLLIETLKTAARARPPTCDGTPAAQCQASILESWKKDSEGSAMDVLPHVACIVRSGVMRTGMPFVADQCYGKVLALRDFWGRPLREAQAGTAVTVVGSEPVGCPGSGTHIIEQPSPALAKSTGAYRRLLQMFVEAYPQSLHLLRPPGLDNKFLHIGNFGQVPLTEAEDIQTTVLYGREAGMNTGLAETGLDYEWSALQPEKQPTTAEEYEESVKNSHVVRVVLKVDTWHSGRLLVRELARLGTRNVTFDVMAVRFGRLSEDELEVFKTAELILCFRSPKLTDGKVIHRINNEERTVMECTVYSDLVSFVKNFAVAMQRKYDEQLEQAGPTATASKEFTEKILGGLNMRTKYTTQRSRNALRNDAKYHR